MYTAAPAGAPLLADIIGLKQCTIMSDYAMNLEGIARRLLDPSQRTLVLAPINSAITALPRKPWVDGPVDAQDPKISPLRNEDRAARNIEAFVERHVVSQYPLPAGAEAKNMAGQAISVEMKDEEKYINGKYKVLVEKTAANGAIWVISGVIGVDDSAARHNDL